MPRLFVSPFERALLFSADGLGDFASTMWAVGEQNKIEILGDISFPHSLGMYYTAITQYLGFYSFGDEYKVMGLASYGKPEYKDEFEKIVLYSGGAKFKLGLKYFRHHKKLVDMNFEAGYPELDILFSKYLEKRLGPARKKDEPIEEKHKNIAASLQSRIEEVIFLCSMSFMGKADLIRFVYQEALPLIALPMEKSAITLLLEIFIFRRRPVTRD